MGPKILPRTANHQLLQQTHALAHTNALSLSLSLSLTHTHTHTHTHTQFTSNLGLVEIQLATLNV